MKGQIVRQIEKVKWDGKRVQIKYSLTDGTDDGVFTLDCTEAPRPAFCNALSGLGKHVAVICDMPSDWGKNLIVRGVSFSWRNDIMGATITALKPLSARLAPLVINTPHAPESPYGSAGEDDSSGDSCLLTPALTKALGKLLDEANQYVDGKRAQGKLFGEAEQ